MVHMEAQHLQRFKVKYFSDLINIEEVWRRIDVVFNPSAPELIEPPREDVTNAIVMSTDVESKLSESEWTNNVYQQIVATEAEVATIFYPSKRTMSLATIVKDLVDTTKKLLLCQDIQTNLEELKTSIQ